MSKRNIGVLNGNWKGGHRSDADLAPLTLSPRRMLEISVEVLQKALRPGVIPDFPGAEASRARFVEQLAQAEKALRDFDEQAALEKMDIILGTEPATDRQMESMTDLFITIDTDPAADRNQKTQDAQSDDQAS